MKRSDNSPMRVAIIMPVFNGGKFIKAAISSILEQTFTNFEFYIVDDCSTDDSIEVIQEFKDNRIVLYRNVSNQGLARTVNKLMQILPHEYIVRMDADDISLPTRLADQISFMDLHPDTVASGSWAEIINSEDQTVDLWKYPENPADLACHCLFDNPLIHPATIIRREALIAKNLLYNPNRSASEDYDLWSRIISAKLVIRNVPKFLLKYRLHNSQAGQRLRTHQISETVDIQTAFLSSNALSISPQDRDLLRKVLCHEAVSILEVDTFFQTLLEQNLTHKHFEALSLERCLSHKLREIAFRYNSQLNLKDMTSLISKKSLIRNKTLLVKIILKRSLRVFLHSP